MLARILIGNQARVLLGKNRSGILSLHRISSKFASQRTRHNDDDDDDGGDGKVSFIDLLRQEDQNVSHQMRSTNESENNGERKQNDFSMKISVEEKQLNLSEIKKHKKETVKYANSENPFFNSEAAALKRQIDIMDEAFRDWQYNFRLTHARRPTLRDMESDPRINSILEQRRKKREGVYTAVFKYKLED